MSMGEDSQEDASRKDVEDIFLKNKNRRGGGLFLIFFKGVSLCTFRMFILIYQWIGLKQT